MDRGGTHRLTAYPGARRGAPDVVVALGGPPPGGRRWVLGALSLAVAVPAGWFVSTRPLLAPAPAETAGAARQASEGAPAPARGIAPLVDHTAPVFVLPAAEGAPVDLERYSGHPVLLNFWATWCAPCRAELPELEHAYREYRDTGLVVLAVNVDAGADAPRVPAYVRAGSPSTGPYTFPVALDGRQEVTRLYRLTGIPATFFIDRSGVIRAIAPGSMSRPGLASRLRTILSPERPGDPQPG